MKYKTSSTSTTKTILKNDHYAAIAYNCKDLTALATDGVIKAGTVIPANDGTAKGILLTDVNLEENPNGTIVVHGFIDTTKLEVQPTTEAETALKGIIFLD